MEMEKEEEVMLHHPLHEHPLIPIKNPRAGGICYGCLMFFSGETAYGCSKGCGDGILFHEECAEMPIKIRHPMHPHHILSQKNLYSNDSCAFCGRAVMIVGYSCASCSFVIHLGCAPSTGLVNLNDERQSTQQHGSHPEHELRLLRRSSSFRCDACGTIEKGNSYICSSTCQYWIHESCALLPPVITRKNLHHHTLSLSFRLPIKYIKFGYVCEVCRKNLPIKYWIYHCEICSYAVHIKCAMNNTSPTATSSSNLSINEAIPQFPINDVAEELIKPFIIREGGEITIPQSINGTYTFPNHNHPLSLNLITSEEENDQKEDGDDDDEYEDRSELICDGCVTPIDPKKTNGNCYYLSCGECKYYFLHWACFHLPPELTSLPPPLHHEPGHKLILETTSPKFSFTSCSICGLSTSGLFYACTECYDFKVDIKCASLPNTIKHAAHPHHLQYQDNGALCSACGSLYFYRPYYTCDSSCKYSLEIACALLPPAVSKHRWDKHPLPLTYDAKINHPEEFYCDICEGKEMNPKMWMYHCRDCDHSFHPRCLTATSGWCRNVKFGQQYVFTSVHPHPLTYQLVTIKRRCSACHRDTYDRPGFQCALCNFVMCHNRYGQQHIEGIQ